MPRPWAAVDVPVTADIEAGYGLAVHGVAATVRAVIAAGAAAVNIEDSGPSGLRPTEEQVTRVAAVRQTADKAGVPLFVNARTDTYLRGAGSSSDRFTQTVRGAECYVAAGV